MEGGQNRPNKSTKSNRTVEYSLNGGGLAHEVEQKMRKDAVSAVRNHRAQLAGYIYVEKKPLKAQKK